MTRTGIVRTIAFFAAAGVTATALIVNAPELDPRFGTCAEAHENGYGPYTQNKDDEYAWYDDRNHDGVVCE